MVIVGESFFITDEFNNQLREQMTKDATIFLVVGVFISILVVGIGIVLILWFVRSKITTPINKIKERIQNPHGERN